MSVIYAEHLNGKKKLQVVLFPPLLHDHIIHHRHHMSSLFSALKNSIQKKGFGQGTEGTKLILVHRAKGADFRSPLALRDRRRHGRRRVFILQIIGPRSHIDSMRSQFLLDMSDTDNTPRRVALGNCKENMENVANELGTWELGTHNCWGNARRAGPIGSIRERSSETESVSLWTAWNLTSTRVSSSVVCRRHFSCLTKAFHGTAWNNLQKGCKRWATALDVETWAINWSNDWNSLEAHFWDLATIISTVVRLARLRWLPKQAKAQLHGGWRRVWKICHWPWNVKSTIGKAEPRNTTQSWIAFGTLVATYNFSASLFCTAHPKLYCTSRAAAFAVDICSHMGQINSTAWKNTFETLPLLFKQWCDWQD